VRNNDATNNNKAWWKKWAYQVIVALITIDLRIFSSKNQQNRLFLPKFFYFIVFMMDFSFHYMKTKEKQW